MATVNREAMNIAGAFVAAGLISILGFVTWALVFIKVPVDNAIALNLLIGNLSALVGMVVGFFFGSSVTTKKQSETIDTLAKNAQIVGNDGIVLQQGQSATATATADGTVIETKP